MSGWAGSDRRGRLPADWPKRREQVKKRAGGRCEKFLPSGKRCPRRGTDCDHKIAGDNHALTNLQWLCEEHHKQKTRAEAAEGYRNMRRRLPKRAEERHPGMRQGTLAGD